MAKYFEEVAATVTLKTAKDLENYFEFAKTNSYVSSYCKETSIVGIENEPLLHINGAGEFVPDARMFQKRTLRRRLLKEDFS